jgi:uncharacterized membrane protein SpoIIM required for sporulation
LTETQFIEDNKKQWRELEILLIKADKDPDRLHELFVKVSSDLAYASTFYPKRSVRAYLNQLTQRVFDSMEKKKPELNANALRDFFRNVLPVEMYNSRKALLTSFLVFCVAVLIGVISTANNPDFTRVILGDQYVDMTELNISNDDPMGVYKDTEQADMFLQITFNNIKVSFFCFIMGIFGSLGTIIILLHNGIMLGTFQYFFYTKGLFIESFLTIWIHGTIEISAIIIAGAAGIVLGNGLLFPSTYDRGTSMQIAARRSVRILIGTTPLFVIAGFLESFITRLTEMPTIIKVIIIGASLLLIVGLYIVYPWWHHRNSETDKNAYEILPNETKPLVFEKIRNRTLNQNIYLGFAQFRTNMGQYFSSGISVLMSFMIICLFIYLWLMSPFAYFESKDILIASFDYGEFPIFFVYWFLITFAIMILTMIYRGEKMTFMNKMVHIKLFYINMLLISLIPTVVFYFAPLPWMFLLFLVIPPHFIAYTLYMVPERGWKVWKELSNYYELALSSWGKALVTFAMIALLHFLLIIATKELIGNLFIDFLAWHDIFSNENFTYVYIMTLIHTFITLMIVPLYFYVFINQLNSEHAKVNATDLWKRFEIFNSESNVFEVKS